MWFLFEVKNVVSFSEVKNTQNKNPKQNIRPLIKKMMHALFAFGL